MCGDDASIHRVSEIQYMRWARKYIFQRTVINTPVLILYVNTIYHIIP